MDTESGQFTERVIALYYTSHTANHCKAAWKTILQSDRGFLVKFIRTQICGPNDHLVWHAVRQYAPHLSDTNNTNNRKNNTNTNTNA